MIQMHLRPLLVPRDQSSLMHILLSITNKQSFSRRKVQWRMLLAIKEEDLVAITHTLKWDKQSTTNSKNVLL
jgi:hypothetical protein